MKIPKLQARAEFRPGSFNAESRTVDLVWTTGAKGLRHTWDGSYYEELEVSPEACRLDRLNAGAPLLNTHAAYSLENQIGVVERAWIEGGIGYATVRLSEREEVAGIVKDVAGGIIRNVSVGYRVHTYEAMAAPQGEPPTYRATDWEPLELSLVPVPFDAGAQTRSGEPPEDGYEVTVITPEPADTTPTPAPEAPADDARAFALGATEEEQRIMENNTTPQGSQEAPVSPPAPTADTRAAEIVKAVRMAGFGLEMAEDLISRGVAVDAARQEIMEKWAAKDQAPTVSTHAGITRDESDTRRRAIEDAIILRANPSAQIDASRVDAARNYRGMSLIEMARESLESQGIRTRGLDKSSIVDLALNNTRGAGHTTSDFANILANVASKSLRNAYEAAPQTFRPICREINAPDFKEISRVQLGEAPRLEAVNEAGEYKFGTIGEGKEVYSLSTFGKIVSITRKVLINDDLSALTRVPALFGRAAADLESDTVWALITGNQTMGDGVALFHADHSNLPAGAALANAALAAARAAMRKQKGLDGQQYLNLQAKYLIVPAALEFTALTMLSSAVVPTAAASVNLYAGTMQPIVEARLDAASTTAWYIAADPGQVDVIEVAYLDGQRGVQITTQDGFEVDGVQIKARMDFGARVIDHRGLVKGNN